MHYRPLIKSGRNCAWATLAVASLAMGAAIPAGAQNIIINEFDRDTGALTAAGNEWVELVLTEPLTAAQLNEYVVGDSTGARAVKFGGYQFTAMEEIAADFPAGTIIVIAGGDAGLAEDLAYDPGSGNWNMTLVLGLDSGDTHLTNVGSGTFDYAGNDVAYVDVTNEGLITGEGFGIVWNGVGGPLGESCDVVLNFTPANNALTTVATLGDDYTSKLDGFWLVDAEPTPGEPNDNDSNGVWITNLRAGIPSGDPLIRVSSRGLDFGSELDNVFPLPTLEFEVRNSALASTALTIDSLVVSPTDDNFRVVPPTPSLPIVLNAGESATITVEFDPLGIPGDYEATLLIGNNDAVFEKQSIEIPLVGSAQDSSPPAGFSGTLPSVYEQDFNTLPDLEQFETVEDREVPVLYVWADNNTLPSWYASRTNNPPVDGIFASTGADNTGFNALSGGLYSFGFNEDSDRALGSVASGSTGALVYGVRLRNDTSETISNLRVEYVGEQWRKAPNTTPHTLEFSYSISSSPFLEAPLSNDGFTNVPTLNFVTPQADGETEPLDGNSPENRVELDATITGISIEPNQEIFLRWRDIDFPGVDHPLAIDDVRVTALPATAPTIEFNADLETFVTEANVASSVQSYEVFGQNLEGDVTVTAPVGLQISPTGTGGWVGSEGEIVLVADEGTLAPTPIYVRALSATRGSFTRNIIHQTPDAGPQPLPVSATIQPGPLFITALDVAIEEDFDTLGSAAQAPLPDGFSFSGPNLDPSLATFATGASAGNTGAGSITGSSGGNYYNFGDGVNAETTDRAVGFLSTGGFATPRSLILTLLNDTEFQLTELDVAYDIEKYRSGSRAFDFELYYSENREDWTLVEEVTENFPSDGANNVIYSPALNFPKSTTIDGLSVNPGQRVYVRWQYTGVGGSTNGQALAVDDISITPRGVPVEPGMLGDINGDGVVNVADVTELANRLAAGDPVDPAVGDVNDDGEVDELDIEALADMIVNP